MNFKCRKKAMKWNLQSLKNFVNFLLADEPCVECEEILNTKACWWNTLILNVHDDMNSISK